MLNGNISHRKICGHNLYGIENYLVSYTRPICQFCNYVFKCIKRTTNDKKTEMHFIHLKNALDLLVKDPRIVISLYEKLDVDKIDPHNF